MKTAFLNAPRTSSSIIATEVPGVMRQLHMAEVNEIWLIVGALYGLTTSPRDWQLCRDAKLPEIKWQLQEDSGELREGWIEKSQEDNLWVIKAGKETVGMVLIYVDDFLFLGFQKLVQGAVEAVSKTWTCSKPMFASETEAVTFCGIEIREHKESQGFALTQQAYEQELLERWPQAKGSNQIHLRIPDPEAPEEDPDANLVREAQALTGALLWLSTRCRPELTYAVHVMSKHAVKRPRITIENGHQVLKFLKETKAALVYSRTASWNGSWGPREQLYDVSS